MRKSLSNRGLLIALLAVLLLSACIPSLQPFYTEKDLIFESSLVGAFSDNEGDGAWTFTKSADREYKLTIKDKEKSSTFTTHLFKLGGDHFIDLYAIGESLDDCPREDFLKASLIPGHLVLKVPSFSPKLALQVMDEDGIKEYLKANKGAVPHSLIESGLSGRLVFTGSSEQMRDFLKRISTEEKCWGKPAEFQKSK
jgi:hypothetical protein